jgi:hypothetical protein
MLPRHISETHFDIARKRGQGKSAKEKREIRETFERFHTSHSEEVKSRRRYLWADVRVLLQKRNPGQKRSSKLQPHQYAKTVGEEIRETSEVAHFPQ